MNLQTPLVSISVVTYQHKNYIKQCLDGILMQQTNFPFEIILGEDESKDGTREICIDYANKYPDKIKLFLRNRNDVIYINGNATGRYNFIENLKSTKGKYIALCEGDDYWTDPLKLQKQVDFLEASPDYGICFHDVKIFDQTNLKLIEDNITRDVEETTDVTELAKGNYIHTPSVMLRNDFTIPDWFKESPIGDWILYLLAIRNGKIKKMKEVMAVYRVHNSSVWSGLSQETRNKKTAISVKLVLDNLELAHSIKLILKRRLPVMEKKVSIVSRLFKKLIKTLK